MDKQSTRDQISFPESLHELQSNRASSALNMVVVSVNSGPLYESQ